MPRAAWTAQELLSTFAEWTAGLTLVPGDRGVFDVTVNGDLVFSRQKERRYPEIAELRNAIKKYVE